MGARALQPSRQRASWLRGKNRLWISSTQRPLGFVDPRCIHPPRRRAVVAHPSSLDYFILDPTPKRRRSPPPKSRPNRPHPIPLRTPSPPPTQATYDQNVGDGQMPTLRGGRRVVWASVAPMPCLHRGASTPRPGEDPWWACAPPMRIASAAENHLQAPAVTHKNNNNVFNSVIGPPIIMLPTRHLYYALCRNFNCDVLFTYKCQNHWCLWKSSIVFDILAENSYVLRNYFFSIYDVMRYHCILNFYAWAKLLCQNP